MNIKSRGKNRVYYLCSGDKKIRINPFFVRQIYFIELEMKKKNVLLFSNTFFSELNAEMSISTKPLLYFAVELRLLI